jgi:hypothetical protein
MPRHNLIASKPSKYKGELWVTWDIESEGLYASKARLWCAQVVQTGEQFSTTDRQEFIDWLESKAPCYAYGHNSMKFDLWSILSATEAYEAKKITSGSKIFQLEHNGVKHRDSRNLFPLSLSQLAVSVGMRKGITPQKFIDGGTILPSDITEDDIRYCMMDVEILAVALQRFRELYARLCGVEPASIELPLTTASAAYRIWCSMSWPEQWTYTNKKGKLRKHASVDVAFNNAFRESQAGGMVRLLNTQPGVIVTGGIVSYDANSMYPSTMLKDTFPDLNRAGWNGGSIHELQRQLARDDRLCLAEVRMTARDGAYLGAPNLDSDNRRNWNLSEYEGWMCGPEIEFLTRNGWDVNHVGDIATFGTIRPFSRYVRTMYEMRMQMRAEGDPAAFMVKILLNALFGRYGIRSRPNRIDGQALRELKEEDDFIEKLSCGVYEHGFFDGRAGQFPYVLDYSQIGRAPGSQWFGFSSYILSRARIELGKAIIAAGDDALYCDTDSVHMRVGAQDRFESMVPIGDDLGEWKCETPDVIPFARYWEPKCYTMMNELMGLETVKQKGMRIKDDNGNFLPQAGNLTMKQEMRTTVSLFDGLRRNAVPGDEMIVEKRSRRFYREP